MAEAVFWEEQGPRDTRVELELLSQQTSSTLH